MQGRRWSSTIEAVAQFRQNRISRGCQDRVSVITFNHEASIASSGQLLTADFMAALDKISPHGGTAFQPAWSAIEQCVQRSPPGAKQTVVFMTDGEAADAAQAAAVASRIYAAEQQNKTGMNTFVVNVQNLNSITLPQIVKAGNGGQDSIQVGNARSNLLMNVADNDIVEGFQSIANLIHMDQTRVSAQLKLIEQQDADERIRM